VIRMQDSDCIFCKIAKKEIDAAWVWEDDEFFAILDNQPNTKGMTLVMTKKHYPSYAFDMPNESYHKLMIASKKVAKLLEAKLKVKRVAMAMEGMGVDHVHIKLYPMYGLDEKYAEIFAENKIFFDKYEGYVTTLLGPKIDLKELKKLAAQIKE